MLRYSHVATYLGDTNSFVTNITDLQTFAGQSGYMLYSITHVGGGFAAFAIGAATQPIEMIDSKAHSSWVGYVGAPSVALVDMGGEPTLFGAGLINGMGLGTMLNSDGGFGGTAQLQGASRLAGDVILLGQFETPLGQFLYSVRDGQTAFDTWRLADNGAVSFAGRSQLPWGAGITGTEISDLEVVKLNDRNYMVSVSALGNYVAAQLLNADGTAGGARMLWADRGLGLNQPTHLTTVTVGTVTYVVVASSQSSSLTTLRLTYSGELLPADHIIDELTTRFRAATALDSVSIDGRAYVFVGGGDDGISVFTMTPEGRLLHLATLSDADDLAMAKVSALSAQVIDGQIALFVASQTERGITQFVFDPGQVGVTRVVGEGRQNGTEGNDMMQASATTRTLSGGAGDDILIAGNNALTMIGGEGADTFVAREVNGLIFISDFEPGVDRLDLSLLGMIRSTAQLDFSPRADGIRIKFGNSAITVRTSDGSTLQASFFDNSMFPIAHYNAPNMRTNLLGTLGNDTLTAGRYGSTISSMAGNDLLFGREGNDILSGGPGSDTMNGGSGNDTMHGGDAADVMRGNAGDDYLFGNDGNDAMNGGAGNDILQGNNGNDLLIGENGNDEMMDFQGHNALWGGNGNDLLKTGVGNDMLSGGAGNDTLTSNYGNDTLDGGEGNDWIDASAGNDTVNGGSGHDTLYGGLGNDRIDGGAGNDSINGHHGDDLLWGMEGNDSVNGLSGRDILIGHGGDDWMRGGSGIDTFYGGAGNDSLMGDRDNDQIFGNSGNDTLFGGAGDDLMDGGDGNDSVIADSGNDTVHGGKGQDTILGLAGHNLLMGGDGNDLIQAYDGNDRIYGETGHDRITSGAGDDFVYGGWGNDTINGNAGSDNLFGETGHDVIYGDAGRDRISGGTGNDRLHGGAGADTLNGDAGVDTFVYTDRASFDGSNDVIELYSRGEDVIDMSGLNLTFIGGAQFSGDRSGGQVRSYWTSETARVVEVDLNGDGRKDLTISLGSIGPLSDSDLLL